MKHILLLEDDDALGEGIRFALESPQDPEPIRIRLCSTLAQAQASLAAQRFHLLILDLNLPDGSGLDLLRRLRGSGCVAPVILLTANDLETDVVMGLELGADDYITKPFSLAILRARVRAQLRRSQSGAPSPGLLPAPYAQDAFVFDFANMRFTKAGQPLELSKTEQRLLRLLVSQPGRVLSREALTCRLWEDGAFVSENALSVAVSRLRAKLEDDPARPRYLKTVYGLGYAWSAE